MKVFEWLDHQGRGEVSDWPRLQSAQRAKLDAKLDMLVGAEVDPLTKQANLPPQLLVGPNYGGEQFIYKLKCHGSVAMRPMICRGPFGDGEWTVLCRATERDSVLTPPNAAAIAEGRRVQLTANRMLRRLLRDDQ